MSNDENHFTLGAFLFPLEFVCPALLGLFAWACFLGLAPAAFRTFSSCFFFFLGFCKLKTKMAGFEFHHNVVSAKGYCKYMRKGIKAKTIVLTCSLGFLLGVAMGTSCGISSSSSSSSSSAFFSPCPEDSVWLPSSFSPVFLLAAFAWEHTRRWFDALKQWIFLSWMRNIQKQRRTHFFLGRLCFLLCLLQQFEVAQIGRVDGEGDRWLTLHMDDLYHWFFLQRVGQKAQLFCYSLWWQTLWWKGELGDRRVHFCRPAVPEQDCCTLAKKILILFKC